MEQQLRLSSRSNGNKLQIDEPRVPRSPLPPSPRALPSPP